MSLDTYANFQAAIADHLARDDLTSQIVDCITLFESEAALELFRERRKMVVKVFVPSGTATFATITGAAANSSGLIRLTVDDSSALLTGFEVLVKDVEGTTEANGIWTVTVIDSTTIDLQSSSFVNTYTSGGTVNDFTAYISLPSDYLGYIRVTSLGNPPQDLKYVAPALFWTEFPSADGISLSGGVPQIFTIEGGNIFIKPEDHSTHIELTYYQKTEALSTLLNWLFTEQVDCYWNGVLEQVYEYLKDYEQAAHYGAAKQKSFDEIKMERFRERDNLAMRIEGSPYGATP